MIEEEKVLYGVNTTWGIELEFSQLSLISNRGNPTKKWAESLNKTVIKSIQDPKTGVRYSLTLDNGNVDSKGQARWTPEIVTTPFKDKIAVAEGIVRELLEYEGNNILHGGANCRWSKTRNIASLTDKQVPLTVNPQLTVGFHNPCFYRYLLPFVFFGQEEQKNKEMEKRLNLSKIQAGKYWSYYEKGEGSKREHFQIMCEILTLMLCGNFFKPKDKWVGNKALLSTLPRTLLINNRYEIDTQILLPEKELKALPFYAHAEYHRDIWYEVIYGRLYHFSALSLLRSLSPENRAAQVYEIMQKKREIELVREEKKIKTIFRQRLENDILQDDDLEEKDKKYLDVTPNKSFQEEQTELLDTIIASLFKYDWISFPPCSSWKEPMSYIDRIIDKDHLPFIFELRRFKKWWIVWRNTATEKTKDDNPQFNKNFCLRLLKLSEYLNFLAREETPMPMQEVTENISKKYNLE